MAFLSDALLQRVSGAAAKEPNAVPVGFLAFGEFVYAGPDARIGQDDRLQVRDPAVLPRFDISQLVSRRSFVFARAGFGKSNLVKLLFADLYGGGRARHVRNGLGEKCQSGRSSLIRMASTTGQMTRVGQACATCPPCRTACRIHGQGGRQRLLRLLRRRQVKLDIRELEPAR